MYGLDLVDFFRGRYSWRKLLVLISRLPLSSAYVEAQLDDPDYAEWLLSQPEPPARGPRLTEWTPEVAALTDIKDRIAELIAAVVASAGGKPGKVEPSARPSTEVDRARKRRTRKRHDDLVAEVREAQRRWEANRARSD